MLKAQTLVFLCVWSVSILLLYGYFEARFEKLSHRLLRQNTHKDADFDNEPQQKGLSPQWLLANSQPQRLVVMYNRVPKTGSTSFMGIAHELAKRNGFHTVHLNVSKNSHTLSLPDQLRFARNVSEWTAVQPALYHGHLAYLDFGRLRLASPIYINVVRDPLERLVSYYYFLRYGDDKRPHLVRSRMGDTRTFDECVAADGKDCHPHRLWLQIPFFCGHAAACWRVGSAWALQQAKRNLADKYLLVGTTDRLFDFVAVLEAALPRLFAGAADKYLHGRRAHVRKTVKKIAPNEATVAKMKASRAWQLEQEFYLFARDQFDFTMSRMLVDSKTKPTQAEEAGASSVPPVFRKTEIFYDLIRPALETKL